MRVGPASEPPWRRLTLALASFAALSAVFGGIELCVWPTGNPYMPPVRLLLHAPFQTFFIPGLMLAGIVGGACLACVLLVARRSPAGIDATLVAGAALSIWIVAEAAVLRGVHWLHVVYGLVGLSLLGLGVYAGWRSGLPRHRWTIAVTAAETLGYLAPTCAGIVAYSVGTPEPARAALVVAGGFCEGLALGVGQAWTWPLAVRRRRYVLLTALGAGVVWSSVLSAVTLVESADMPAWLTGMAVLAAAVVGLLGIGTAQWIELRHHAARTRRWIGWTALAWICALPLSFTPGPFVDESTPLAAHIVLWGCGGALMAYVMALVTWQGVVRIAGAAARPTPVH